MTTNRTRNTTKGNTMNRIEELRAQLNEATESTTPQREELARLEAEQAHEQQQEQQRIRGREHEWANTYIRTGNTEDKAQLDNELKAARSELNAALNDSPIIHALAKLSALEQRKQIITDELMRARMTLGQQPNPVEHTMRFDPTTTINTIIDNMATDHVDEAREAQEQARLTLVTGTTTIGDGQPTIDPNTLPIQDRAAHGHNVEQYTQNVDGYGLVAVLRDTTTGETQVADPNYIEWLNTKDNDGSTE